MPVALVLIVGLGALFHVALGRWVASPWLVPDLTLVSLVLAMAQAPEHSINLALLGGGVAMVLTTHQPMLVGFAYMAAGVLVILLSLQWDLKLPIVQLLTTGAAEAVLLVLWGFAGVQVTPGLLLLSVVRVSVTMASVPLARRLVPIVVPGFVK